MKMHVDAAYRSLNKYGEELCGDKVKITRTKNSTIAVLADGLGINSHQQYYFHHAQRRSNGGAGSGNHCQYPAGV